MAGFLVAEEGLNAGLVIRFEEGDEWVIGRDPEVSYEVLEDPMVSRKHVICRLTPKGYTLENLSVVNPATLNGKKLEEIMLLQEGDTVQIGSDIFHFTLKNPLSLDKKKKSIHEGGETPTIYEEPDDLSSLAFSTIRDSRWMIKVVAGPNSGAEFGIAENHSFIIGKDPKSCDILFQDLSVSAQHAKIAINSAGNVTIEDINSLNGVYVNGKKITESTQLQTQDLMALGTTSFLIIDQHQTRETIVSPINEIEKIQNQNNTKEEKVEEDSEKKVAKKNWKNMVIPFKHLIIAGLFVLLLVVAFGGIFSLFKGEKIIPSPHLEVTQEISKILSPFPNVEFSFNSSTGKIFVLGHVMTEIDHQELLHLLQSLPFLHSIEDNVIIDELVWVNTNALLMKNSKWRGVSLTSTIPGHFVLRGYVQTPEYAKQLVEYMNFNFPYLDKLDNQVVVENTVEAQIRHMLLENGFTHLTFQLSNGELILAGRAFFNQQPECNKLINELKKIQGVRMLKNLITFSHSTEEVIDISSKYKVSGSSKYGNKSQYVVINGKILSNGDTLDGMTIINMQENTISLEKDGVKYKINYN